MKYSFPLLILVLLLLSSCGEDEAELKFKAIRQSVHELNVEEVFTQFDDHSNQYLEQVVTAVVAQNPDAALGLGRNEGIPINTMQLYDQLDDMNARMDSLGKEERVEQLRQMTRVVLAFGQFGVFRSTEEQPLKLAGSNRIKKGRTDVRVNNILGPGEVFGVNYEFHLQNDEWKLNFLSTLTMTEKIYGQAQERSGLGYYEYAKSLNDNMDTPVEFSYRRPL